MPDVTISRHLMKAGPVTPAPEKRPRSSYIRFAAELPNECWQSDFTHYRLAGRGGPTGRDVEILSWLDAIIPDWRSGSAPIHGSPSSGAGELPQFCR